MSGQGSVGTNEQKALAAKKQQDHVHDDGSHHRPAEPIPFIAGNDAGEHYQYSQCTGTKKALLVGINYIGTESALGGCINDVINMRKFLISHYGYDAANIRVLKDDGDRSAFPTRKAMLQNMEWLVKGAKPNDSLFFHFSGHGSKQDDRDGDEADRQDENICPLDYETAGKIHDDQLHKVLVSPLPMGCRLTAIFDSCHSGSVLDLPFMYNATGTLRSIDLAKEASAGLLAERTEPQSLHEIVAKTIDEGDAHSRSYKTRTSGADVYTFSGCKDDQLSMDVLLDGQRTGAMSHAFVKALTEQPDLTFQGLLNRVVKTLVEYEQTPQLSCCHPLDVKYEWCM